MQWLRRGCCAWLCVSQSAFTVPRVEVVHGGGDSHAMMVHDPKSAEKLVRYRCKQALRGIPLGLRWVLGSSEWGVPRRTVVSLTLFAECTLNCALGFVRLPPPLSSTYRLFPSPPYRLPLQLYSANATVCAPEGGVLPAGVHRFRFGFTLPVEFIPSVDLRSYVHHLGPACCGCIA